MRKNLVCKLTNIHKRPDDFQPQISHLKISHRSKNRIDVSCNLQPHQPKRPLHRPSFVSTQQTHANFRLCRHRGNEWISLIFFSLPIGVRVRACVCLCVRRQPMDVGETKANGTFFRHKWLVFAVDSLIVYRNTASWSCVFSIVRPISRTNRKRKFIFLTKNSCISIRIHRKVFNRFRNHSKERKSELSFVRPLIFIINHFNHIYSIHTHRAERLEVDSKQYNFATRERFN